AIAVISESPDGVLWIGGDNGIARFENGQAVAVTNTANGFPGSHVTSLVGDERGAFWAGTGAGLVRLERSEFDAVAAAPRHRVRLPVADVGDVSVPPERLRFRLAGCREPSRGNLYESASRKLYVPGDGA